VSPPSGRNVKRELLVPFMSLGLQHLKETSFRFCIQSLDKLKALARGDILLILSAKGQDALTDDDFELLLFRLPAAHIP
jgi:hypothetical protein